MFIFTSCQWIVVHDNNFQPLVAISRALGVPPEATGTSQQCASDLAINTDDLFCINQMLCDDSFIVPSITSATVASQVRVGLLRVAGLANLAVLAYPLVFQRSMLVEEEATRSWRGKYSLSVSCQKALSKGH